MVPPASRRSRTLVCHACNDAAAAVIRPSTGHRVCRACFVLQVEEDVHRTIQDQVLFCPGERVAIGASGGKDSTVLAYMMALLNKRHQYGLDLVLISVDEGITGYRDDSLRTVEQNKRDYGLPLHVVSYRELYGWTMDEIVQHVGQRNNCTYCGVFRRQALDRAAQTVGAQKVLTGHNADDMAETVLMNLLRGDIARLGRCTDIITGSDGPLPRAKPFKYIYQKEIVLYAHYKKLVYFSTECSYAPRAYRGYAREYLKQLERINSQAVLDIIRSAELFMVENEGTKQFIGKCRHCGYMTSASICKACVQIQLLKDTRAKRPIILENTRRDDSFPTAVTNSRIHPSDW